MPSGDLPVRASYPHGAGLPLSKKRQSSWTKQHTVPGLSFSASRDFPILEHTSSTLHRSSMKLLGSRRKSATESEFSSAAAARDNRDNDLNYSRVEITADARRLGSGFIVKSCSRSKCSPLFIIMTKPDPGCGHPLRMGCNEVDAARSARP